MDATTSMYLRGVVSFALAARIPGLGIEGFEDYLRLDRIEPYTPLIRPRIEVPTL